MTKTAAFAFAAGLAVASLPALADHNSHWGEGTGLDPKGIHDARIDSRLADDLTSFRGGQSIERGVRPEPVQRMERPETIAIDRGAARPERGGRR